MSESLSERLPAMSRYIDGKVAKNLVIMELGFPLITAQGVIKGWHSRLLSKLNLLQPTIG